MDGLLYSCETFYSVGNLVHQKFECWGHCEECDYWHTTRHLLNGGGLKPLFQIYNWVTIDFICKATIKVNQIAL